MSNPENPDLQKQLTAIATALEGILAQEAASFVAGVQKDVVDLTVDQVKAIFADEMYRDLPVAFKLSGKPTVAEIADREAVAAARTAILELCSEAEKVSAEEARRVRAAAKQAAAHVAGIATDLVIGSLSSMLIPKISK